MSKQELERENWSYILYKDGDIYTLDVVIGTVGMWEKTIILSQEEVTRYKVEGKTYLDKFVYEISGHRGLRHSEYVAAHPEIKHFTCCTKGTLK